MIICEYNFGTQEIYERMGSVPLYAANLFTQTWEEDTGKLVEFAREKNLPITYSAKPMEKPVGDFRLRRESHEEALNNLAGLMGNDVQLSCILLDDEIQASTDEELNLREMEQTAWTTIFKHVFPNVPLIRWLWSESGLYDRRVGNGWQPGRYWSGKGPRDVISQVVYYPDDIMAMMEVIETLTNESRNTGLPGCLTISLGAGYNAEQNFMALDYDIKWSQIWGLFLSMIPEIKYIWLYPSPGDERYAETMPLHLDAFLTGYNS
jgi:hypothetical protein